MEIVLINETDIREAITMKEVIEADKNALKSYSNQDAIIPLRTNISVSDKNQCLFMPGFSSSDQAVGVKIVSVFPDNISKGIPSVPSTMILVNEMTGEVMSMLDGTYLTSLRTGAIAGAATDLLANKHAENFLLIGTGGQALCQLEAVLTVRNIKRVMVYDIDFLRAQRFAKQATELYSKCFNVIITASENLKEDTTQADIITTVTTSKKPVFDAALVKSGCHINAIGSYTPDMQELPAEILRSADSVYVDTYDGVFNESGDFITPFNNGQFSREEVTGELGELILGKTAGRKSEASITLFKSTGTAVLDVVVAKKIYDNVVALNKGHLVKY